MTRGNARLQAHDPVKRADSSGSPIFGSRMAPQPSSTLSSKTRSRTSAATKVGALRKIHQDESLADPIDEIDAPEQARFHSLRPTQAC